MRNVVLVLTALLCMALSARPTRSIVAAAETEFTTIEDRVFPEGVVEVEYIEATGNQYINTGIPYNSYTDEINCTVEITDVVNYGYVFGCNETINGANRFFGVRRFSSEERWQVMCASGRMIQGLYLNKPYHIRITPAVDGSFINDYYFFSYYNDNYVYTRPLYLCAVNNNNNGDGQNKNKVRLYHFSYSREGIMLLYLVPVKVDTDGTWVGAMYDFVSETLFFNNGRGNFLIGPDKE